MTEAQYKTIISLIRSGFICDDGRIVKSNDRIATVLTLEANLGLRISDILRLKLSAIIQDGDRYRLDLIEKKTEKKREFTVPMEIYVYIQNFALMNGISPSARLFDLSERAVQKHLKIVCDYLGYDNISTHSFRKYFATTIYRENNFNIELVRILLQHSTATTTQRYIGLQRQEIEDALQKHIKLL